MKGTNFSNNILFKSFQELPTAIENYSFTIENSIYSLLKLYAPLNEIIDEKYFGSKRNFPHHIYYVKVYALNYEIFKDKYLDIELNKQEYKIFPQSNFFIIFNGIEFNINSNATLQIKGDMKKNSIIHLFSDEEIKYYQVTIDDKNYLFIIEYDKHIEIDGILKSAENFDIINTLKSEVLYIKDQNIVINFIERNNNNNNNITDFKYMISKGSVLIIDIKSKFSIKELKKQIKFHDDILYGLYNSCNENIKKFYYLYIITDYDKTADKEKILKEFLAHVKFKLNVILVQTVNSTICNHGFDVVIDKETLVKDINKKIDKLEKKVDEIENDVSEIKRDVREINETLKKELISEIQNKVVPQITKNIMDEFNNNIIPNMMIQLQNQLNNRPEEVGNNQDINNEGNNDSEGFFSKLKSIYNGIINFN